MNLYYAKLIHGDNGGKFDVCVFGSQRDRETWLNEWSLFKRAAMTDSEANDYISTIKHPIRTTDDDGITWIDDKDTSYFEDGLFFEV